MTDSTVIIGHGPSLQNSSMGQYIDSFKYVLRFPYFKNWQIPEHYGIRTSYFCATVGRAKARLRKRRKPDHGYYIWSKNQKNIGDKLNTLIEKHGGKNVTHLIAFWQEHLTKCKYPFFSHGTGGICVAAAILKKNIIVLGCDLLKTGDVSNKEYIGSWTYEGRYERGIGHPLDQERNIVNKIAEFYNVKIEFK